jgi:Lipocalin-like domain
MYCDVQLRLHARIATDVAAFHTDEEKQTLAHSMFVSLFPNWLGQTQPRVVKIEGDMLHLSSATPIMSGGKKVNSHLVWHRAPANLPAG